MKYNLKEQIKTDDNMKKILVGILGLILLFSSISCGFADNGTYNGVNNTVTVNESGNNVVYDSVCVDKNQNINHGAPVNTTDKITVKNGTIEYIIDNWYPDIKNNTTAYNNFQNGIWNISENSSLANVDYPDFYNHTKTVINETTVSEQTINGTKFIVTTIKEVGYNFIFRMTGDGHGTGIQDLLLYIATAFENETVKYLEIPEDPIIPPEDPVTPPEGPGNTTEPETPDTPNTPEGPGETPNEPVTPATPPSGPGSENPTETPVTAAAQTTAMKETGIPIVAILFVLIASLSGIVIRKR